MYGPFRVEKLQIFDAPKTHGPQEDPKTIIVNFDISEPPWAIFGHLGALLDRLGALVGHLGALLSPLGALLGPSWARPGPNMEPSWAILGPS